MTMPSPFELGRSIGGNLGGGIQRGTELRGIDQILSQIGDASPEEVQNVMGRILTQVSPQNREIAASLLQNKFNQIQSERQAQAQEALGVPRNLRPDLAKEYLKQKAKGAETKSNAQFSFDNAVNMIQSRMAGRDISGARPSYAPGAQGEAYDEQFDNSMIGLVGALREMLNPKGPLAIQKWNYILNRPPKSSDTAPVMLGKLMGIADAFESEGQPIDRTALLNLAKERGLKTLPQTKPAQQPPQQQAVQQPIQAAPAAPQIQEGQTATGPNGQKIIFRGGQWQPA